MATHTITPALRTGLRSDQVTTWFANQRKRHWFPDKRKRLIQGGARGSDMSTGPSKAPGRAADSPSLADETCAADDGARDRSNRRLNVDRRRFGTRIRGFHTKGGFSRYDVHSEGGERAKRRRSGRAYLGTAAQPASEATCSPTPDQAHGIAKEGRRDLAIGSPALVWGGQCPHSRDVPPPERAQRSASALSSASGVWSACGSGSTPTSSSTNPSRSGVGLGSALQSSTWHLQGWLHTSMPPQPPLLLPGSTQL